MNNVETIIKNQSLKSELQRLDSSEGHTELVLDVVFHNSEALKETIEAFKALDLSVTYISGGND